MARIERRVIGHVGWAHREIAVGTETLAIAGVSGVLISADARGMRLGRELMSWAAQSMRDRGRLAFGYLGCRKQVVPFYESCGWNRILAREKSIGRDGESVVDEFGPPILILPIAPLETWPDARRRRRPARAGLVVADCRWFSVPERGGVPLFKLTSGEV